MPILVNGRLKGVHSASDAEPLKKSNFPPEFAQFEGKLRYSDWRFEFDPSRGPGVKSAHGSTSSRIQPWQASARGRPVHGQRGLHLAAPLGSADVVYEYASCGPFERMKRVKSRLDPSFA